MEISLIQPKHLRGPDRIYEPLGLGYIASYLMQKGYKDISIHSATFESDKKIVKEAALADIVGITAMSPMMTHANILASAIKRKNPKAIIVLGGFHPSALPEATLNNKNIDFVVRGEGEETFYELVKAAEKMHGFEDISGISYRYDGRVIHNQPRELIDDLDTIPYPARHLFGQKDFTRKYYQYLGERRVTVLSSRGCPFECRFCSSQCVWARKWRSRSAKSIIIEIKDLIDRYNVEYIDFLDGIFTLNKQRVLDFCNMLICDKIKISWGCYVHVTTVDKEMLAVMKEAGCREIYIGVESGSAVILKELNKKISVEGIINTCRIAKDISLSILALIVIGFPEEDRNTIKKTEDLINKIKPDYVAFNILTPMPGCDYYEYAKQKGYVNNNTDWSEVDWDKATMPTRHLSIEDINKEYKRLRKKFVCFSRKKRFNLHYFFSKGIIKFKNIPISELNFLVFKLYKYIKFSILIRLFKVKD